MFSIHWVVLNKAYNVVSLNLAFYCSSTDIEHPDSLCFGATELAIFWMDTSTDILKCFNRLKDNNTAHIYTMQK